MAQIPRTITGNDSGFHSTVRINYSKFCAENDRQSVRMLWMFVKIIFAINITAKKERKLVSQTKECDLWESNKSNKLNKTKWKIQIQQKRRNQLKLTKNVKSNVNSPIMKWLCSVCLSTKLFWPLFNQIPSDSMARALSMSVGKFKTYWTAGAMEINQYGRFGQSSIKAKIMRLNAYSIAAIQ